MGEFILIHIGQAGIGMGKACWELLCYEHGILLDRDFVLPRSDSTSSNRPMLDFYNPSPLYHPFFTETENRKLQPRSIMVDLGSLSINSIRNSCYRNLFNSNFLINGPKTASNLFSRGYFKTGLSIIPTVMNQIRIAADECSSLQGFIIFHSHGGGTGSGLTSLIMQELFEEYPKKTILEFATYSSSHFSQSILEPYNSVLYTHSTIDLLDCTFLLENEKIFEICRENLNITNPKFINIDQIIAQVMSSMTSSHRYNGPLKAYLQDFHDNLVPFPRLHFPTISLAPIVKPHDMFFQYFTLQKITKLLFQSSNQMINTGDEKGKYFSSMIMYQGDISPNEYPSTVHEIKRFADCNFVEWCPPHIKFGISHRIPCVIPNTKMGITPFSACMVANKTSSGKPFERINERFDLLFLKKTFLHWYYNEGMEHDDFTWARENVGDLVQDYLKLQNEEITTKDISINESKYYHSHWNIRSRNFKLSLLEKGIWKKRYEYGTEQK